VPEGVETDIEAGSDQRSNMIGPKPIVPVGRAYSCAKLDGCLLPFRLAELFDRAGNTEDRLRRTRER
jgi:hypothetical protein